MTPAAVLKLERLYALVRQALDAGVRPAAIIDRLVREHGGAVATSSNPPTLRVAGVTGSSTNENGGKALLESWERCAKRRLEREGRL